MSKRVKREKGSRGGIKAQRGVWRVWVRLGQVLSRSREWGKRVVEMGVKGSEWGWTASCFVDRIPVRVRRSLQSGQHGSWRACMKGAGVPFP